MVAHAESVANDLQPGVLHPVMFGSDLSEHELLSAVVTESPIAMTVIDAAGIAIVWNPAAERLFGWSVQEVVGHRLPSLDPALGMEHDELRARTLAGDHVLDLETTRRHRDGHMIDVAISTVPLRDRRGRAQAVLGIYQDITKRKAVEADLSWQAQHDELTRLPNRRGLMERIGALAADRDGFHGAIAVLNIDRLKEINDSLGLAVGDEVLRAFAKRFSRAVRPSDVVARLDGEIFVVVMPGIAARNVKAAIDRLMDRLGSHYRIGGRELGLEVTVGAVVCSASDAPEESLRRAGVALRQARLHPNRRVHVLQAEDDRAFVQRVELAGRLSGAAERGELRLHFQPLVCAASGRVTGVEALVRW
ncbi:MAG: diguanylate cyclase domain-containing protein [Candidatus Dormibacteria bacterium]